MDGDVAFGQYRHAGYAVRLEVMKMDMQERRARGLDAAAQGGFDVIDVVEPLGAMQVDDQMHTGAANAFADGEMVRFCVGRRDGAHVSLQRVVCLGRVLQFAAPCRIARGRFGYACRPPQPEVRNQIAGEPMP